MEVIKASGEKEAFDKEKFCRSLEEAGASPALTEEVCSAIEDRLKPGITTSDLFRFASQYLREKDPASAARYNVKQGIMDLGPAGFLFEQYVEMLAHALGFETKRNQMMEGACVSHEVDVVATKGGEHYLVEAKYRNDPGGKTDITTVMYADARLVDISKRRKEVEKDSAEHMMWVITNAKFTTTAIEYGACRNMRLVGWNYPKEEGLEDIVREYLLYPVTVLPSVNRFARERFADNEIILAHDLVRFSPEELTKRFEIYPDIAKGITKEAHALVYGTSS